ncbi:FCD domain-containing protein [uncultured Marivita sp.]|uniref:FCD domain-containing protein n=1 Tax=uncultured Marivita sp. TaxID=888080 RepID=UPI0026144BF4|nr:FCD domain-containing protein [uncultured Marivita sp.]
MKRKKFEEIADALELKIISGALKVQDRLPPEREIMEMFAAGRASVREALFSLERKGLVEMRHGARGRVAEPSVQPLVETLSGAARYFLSRPRGAKKMQDARISVEAMLARDAARKAGPDDIERLYAAFEANAAATDAGEFQKTDLAFHSTIADIVGNEVFIALVSALHDWLIEQRAVSSQAVSTQDVVAEHREIYEAIAAGREYPALEAMERHLTAVSERYWRAITED